MIQIKKSDEIEQYKTPIVTNGYSAVKMVIFIQT
jgi:hypothetical protein